jgi:hypothetical protein
MGRDINDILIKHGITLSEDELEHAGVKGMRWGRRKQKSSSDDSDADSGPPKPSVKTMTDDELKSAINRIKMEKEFTKLTAPEVSRGRKLVAEILLDVGKTQAKNHLNRKVESFLVNGGAKALVTAAAKASAKKAAPAAGRQLVQFAKRPGF